MSEFKAQSRPDRASQQSSRKISRHRAESARPASAWGRLTANIPSLGRRTAVLATACTVLVGVGAAGQAAEQTTPQATSEAAPAAADAIETLSFDKTLISALPSPTAASVAPQSVTKPAPKATQKAAPAPAKAAPAKAAPKQAVKAAPAPKPAAAPAAKVVPAKVAPTKPAPARKPAAPVAVNDPAGAQAYAAGKLSSYGWAPDQMQCLKKLWTKESEWRTTATNPSSGAYGIVQSLPAEKMASSGADYRTNYRTQINWGLGYIEERYGSPCQALNFHYANNWY
ncbi:aggregation-promoting factor C-terminal-like domain-containing protein [Arthrobacter sp. D1-17]